jgi:hypothetical protein
VNFFMSRTTFARSAWSGPPGLCFVTVFAWDLNDETKQFSGGSGTAGNGRRLEAAGMGMSRAEIVAHSH